MKKDNYQAWVKGREENQQKLLRIAAACEKGRINATVAGLLIDKLKRETAGLSRRIDEESLASSLLDHPCGRPEDDNNC